LERGILTDNSFALSTKTVWGGFMEIAARKGRSEKPDLTCGIFGEHGGDPNQFTPANVSD